MDRFSFSCDLFEKVPTGLALLDANGYFENVNSWFLTILGFSGEELFDIPIFDLIAPENRFEDESNLRAILSGPLSQFQTEMRFVRKDGMPLWIRLSGSVFRQRRGHFSLISAIDINEEKKAKEALKRSEQRFQMAEIATNDAIWEWDSRNDRMIWNRGLETLLGYRAGEIENNFEWWIEKIHPDDRNRTIRSLQTTIQERKDIWTAEFRFLCGDGHYATIMEKACIEYDSEKSVIRIIGSKSDITEIRRYQRELEKAKEEALRAAEAKSSFLANISHEIRTPLGAILGFTEFLMDPEINSQQRKGYLQAIHRNGILLSHLVDEILDLAKLEFHSMEVDRIYFNLSDVLEHVHRVLRLRAEQKRIGLEFHLDPSVPPFLKTDPIRLQQILINIVGNAVKFTEKGRVDVTFECIDSGRHGDELKLKCTVKDTGIGLTTAEQSRLFQRFAQVDETMTRRFGGTGLGLFLSRELAHALGGDVILQESHPDQGSTFVITVIAGLREELEKAPMSLVSDRQIGESPVAANSHNGQTAAEQGRTLH